MKASLLVVLRPCSLPLLLLLVVVIISPCLALQRDSGNVMTWGRRELESTVSEGTRVNGSDFVVAAGLQQQQHLPKQVVRITQTLTLELPEDDTNQVVTDGDVESFLCLMSTMYTHLLLLGSQPPDQERDKQGQGQVQVQVQLDNATWSFTQAQATVQMDVTVPGVQPELLLTSLQNVSISDMNNWLRNHVRRQESFPWKTIAVMAWDGEIVVSLPHDIATTTTNDGNYYFSTAFCGVARVSLEFAFFNDLVLNTTAANNTDYQTHVNNLLCSSSEYFAGLFTQLWTLVHGQSSPQQRQRQQDLVLVTLDRINSGIIPLDNDDNAESPLDVTITLELDARAYVASSHRRIPAVLLLQWLQQSDWQEYIQQAVWESVPYSSNLFFHTNSVKFHGNVRDYYTYLEESISSVTSVSISTDHCVDGVMMLRGSADDTTAMAAPQKLQKLSPTQLLTTNWILHFGFQDHVGAAAVSPTTQDMKALFCQTFVQFKNMFQPQPPIQQEAVENPTSRSSINKNGAETPFYWRQNYTNLTMQAYDWSFDTATNYPISLAVIVQAYTEIPGSSPRRVDPLLLWDKIQERFDIQTFFSDYVWKDIPTDSYFYFSNRIRYEGGVIPEAQVESATTITYKSQDCFRVNQANTLYPTGEQVAATAVDGALANEVDGNGGQVSRDPTKVTAVDIDTSAIVIHLPNIPVNDGSDTLTQSLADMFTAMIASKPRRGIKLDDVFNNNTEEYISRPLPPKETGPQPARAIPPPEYEPQSSESLPPNDNEQLPVALAQGTNVSQPSRLPDDEGEPQPSRPLPPKLPPTRHRNLQVNIDLKSITLGEISSISDCSEFFGQAKGSLDDKACSKVPIHFKVEVVDEDPEEVKQEFVVMAQVGIETGLLQEKLDQRDPDSGLTLVPDPAQTAAIAVEAATMKPPDSPSKGEEETTSTFDENEAKSSVPRDSIMEVIPQNSTATSAEGGGGPSSVTTIIIVLLSVIIGIYAIINVYGLNKLRRHETRSDAQESGLLSRQLREAKYHDVI